MDNENPTILNASDLPSRKRQGRRNFASKMPNGGSGLLSSIAPTAHTIDAFSTGDASNSGEDEDSDGDDYVIDSIDEQEIYGQ